MEVLLVLDKEFWWIRIRLGYLVMGEYVMTGEMSEPTIGQYDKRSKSFRVVGEQAVVPTDRVRPISKIQLVGDKSPRKQSSRGDEKDVAR